MIILHSHHEKQSRRFVELYGKNHQIIEYPECVNYYPRISAFPSVIFFIPTHRIPTQEEYLEKKIEHPDFNLSEILFPEDFEEEEFDEESKDLDEEYDEDLEEEFPLEEVPLEEVPSDFDFMDNNGIIYEYIHVYRCPESMEEIELYEEEWKNYVEAYPI